MNEISHVGITDGYGVLEWDGTQMRYVPIKTKKKYSELRDFWIGYFFGIFMGIMLVVVFL